MHFSFRGIVLSQIPYSDSSSIVKFLSRDLGLQSVLVKGLSGKRGKGIRPLLNKMNVVEVEAFRKKEDQLAVLKNLRSAPDQAPIMDVRRSAILLFVNEVLCRTVKEGHEEKELFDLVMALLGSLYSSENYADLHLVFMMKLTSIFGAQPELPEIAPNYFDMIEGSACAIIPNHSHYVEGEICRLFFKCLGTDLAKDATLGATNEERRILLEKIIEYYQIQLDEKLELRSHKVLHTVLGEA